MIGLLLCVLVTIAALIISGLICFANMMRSSPGPFEGRGGIVIVWIAVALCWLWWGLDRPAFGHDHNRPGLDSWYSGLKSGKGPCCGGPTVDAKTLDGPEWEAKNGRYRVFIDGAWMDVPDDAVLTDPNKDGRALVWPTWSDGKRTIRCFMPGSMT